MGPLFLMAAATAQLASPAVAGGAQAGPAVETAAARSGGQVNLACSSAPFDIGGDVDVLRAWRVFAGSDRASHAEAVTLPGKRGNYYGGAVRLTQFDLGRPTHVGITYGQPGITIPPHAAPYREIFVIVAGSSRIHMPDGQVIDLRPGTIMIADDIGVAKPRGGTGGPCGYIAIDLQFSPPPLPEIGASYDKK